MQPTAQVADAPGGLLRQHAVTSLSLDGVTVPLERPRLLPQKNTLLLGVAHAIVGILSITVNSISIETSAHLATVGHGIWGGVLFIVLGVICIKARNTRKRWLVILTLALSVVSAAVTLLILVTVSSMGVEYEAGRLRCYWKNYGCIHMACQRRLILEIVQMVLALTEGGASIWTCVLCGAVVFTRKSTNN